MSTEVQEEVSKPRIMLLVGSPHKGASVRLASLIEQGVLSAGGVCDSFALFEREVMGCGGCNTCIKTGLCAKTLYAMDDFIELDEMLDAADMLVVVTPIYFAGPPAQLKAVYDRFQPKWAKRYALGQTAAAKRPAALCVLGQGGDPFGYEPLVIITRSALNIADFALGEVYDFIGYGNTEKPNSRSERDEEAVSLGQTFVAQIQGGA